MSEPSVPAGTVDATSVGQPSAAAVGAVLRDAREAAGLSIDGIAQQLKLHPRQVQALEDGRFELLPGRTFVRGFLRNYARAVNLDPGRLLAMLPDIAPETLAPTTHNMGEIRFENAPRRNWSRWAIPLVLILLVALAAVYEFLRPAGDSPRGGESSAPASTQPASPGPTSGTPDPGTVPPPGGTPLPNPLAAPSADPARARESGTSMAPSGALQPSAVPGTTGGIVSTAIPDSAPGESTLVIVYGGRSWTEVRDATGKVLLSLTGSPGMTQSVSGTPPLEVVIGSVADVSLRFRGVPVDLAPYRRANVARLRLD